MAKRGTEAPRLWGDDLSATARRHLAALYDENPFLALLGVRVLEAGRGRVQMDECIRCRSRRHCHGVGGYCHGGGLFFL